MKGLRGLILGLVSATPLLSGAPTPCNTQKSCLEGIEAFGQALYWKWTGTRLEFAAETGTVITPTVTKQTSHALDPDYQWGYRVGFGWRPCHQSVYAELSYLRFAKTQQAQAFGFPVGFGTFFSSIGNTFGLCTVHLRTEYENVDLTVGAFIWRCRPLALHIYGGGRWIYLRQSAVLDGPNTPGPGRLQDFSKFNGGAFKLGLGVEYSLCCLKVFGAFDILTLLGTQSSNTAFQDPVDLFISPEPNAFRVSTGRGLRAGFKYDRVCGCCRIGAEIGYEIQTYVDVMRPELRRGQRELESPSHSDGGFAGPYAGLKVGY